jgi:hypothetical protein
MLRRLRTVKADKFPVTITAKGVSAVIRKTSKMKGGKRHDHCIVEYRLSGRRKQVWRSDFGEAEAVARDACIEVGNGNQSALELSDRARLVYLRASPARIRNSRRAGCFHVISRFGVLCSAISQHRHILRRFFIKKPGNQESSKQLRGFLVSLLNCFWLRLGRAAILSRRQRSIRPCLTANRRDSRKRRRRAPNP